MHPGAPSNLLIGTLTNTDLNAASEVSKRGAGGDGTYHGPDVSGRKKEGTHLHEAQVSRTDPAVTVSMFQPNVN